MNARTEHDIVFAGKPMWKWKLSPRGRFLAQYVLTLGVAIAARSVDWCENIPFSQRCANWHGK